VTSERVVPKVWDGFEADRDDELTVLSSLECFLRTSVSLQDPLARRLDCRRG